MKNAKSSIRTLKIAATLFAYVMMLPAILFVSAGTLNWIMGWLHVGVYIGSILASRIMVLRKNPDLLYERARYGEARNVKHWDRILMPLVASLPLFIYVAAGLDFRFGWSPKVPLTLQHVALIIMVLGLALSVWAMAVNRFFSAVMRIQKDRGQIVVDSGPYKLVRHPGYAGGLIYMIAAPLTLGSLWAIIPAIPAVAVLVLRTALEDAALKKELPGYTKYAAKVRYRLIPGIW
jgi:protein-S-isoprenylcysteine O-methyltransferase Ste14